VLETKLIGADVPSHLKGVTICLYKQNSHAYSCVPAEKFKLVPRKQQRIVTKVAHETLKSCKEISFRKNRVSALAGAGQREGFEKDVSSSKIDIESKTGFVGGLQYQRSLNDRFSVGVQGQSNKTGSLMIGVDF
jgi:tetraacyldisaccharide-1-P 4'-kinase